MSKLPKNLLYQTRSESANARSYTSLIQPQNNGSQTVAGQTITFNLPTGNNMVLNSSECYLHCDITVTNGGVASDYTRWGCAGVSGLIQRLRVYCGGTLLEDIDNYGLLVAKMNALQLSMDSVMGKQNVLSGISPELYVETVMTGGTYAQYGATKGFGRLQLCGDRLNDYNDDIAINQAITETYGFQLISSIVGTLSEKYLPLFKMTGQNLRVELQLVNDPQKAFVSHKAVTCTISDFEFAANFIELSDSAMSIIEQSLMGQDLSYVVSQWRNYVNTNTISDASASTVTVNSLIPAKFSSLKSLIVVPRDRADGALTYDSFGSNHYSLSQYQWRIGGSVIPSKPPSSYEEFFYELIKCIDCISNLNHKPCINNVSYTENAYCVANNETLYAQGTTTCCGQFMIGLDCEVYANCDKSELFSGMNTQGMDIYLQSTHAVALNAHGGRTNIRFDTFALYDAVLVFDQAGNVNVRT